MENNDIVSVNSKYKYETPFEMLFTYEEELEDVGLELRETPQPEALVKAQRDTIHRLAQCKGILVYVGTDLELNTAADVYLYRGNGQWDELAQVRGYGLNLARILTCALTNDQDYEVGEQIIKRAPFAIALELHSSFEHFTPVEYMPEVEKLEAARNAILEGGL